MQRIYEQRRLSLTNRSTILYDPFVSKNTDKEHTVNTLTIGRKKYNDITSLKEASEIFERARQEHLYNGGGGSDFYNGKLTFNKERFTISWNGRVWKGTKCGGEIAYDNRRSDVKAYFNADRDLLWCAVCTISDESEALTASDLGEDGGQVCDACGRVYNATAATWEGAPSPVTDEQIRALRNEALEAGDVAQAAICTVALTSRAEWALADCARAIANAEAQS